MALLVLVEISFEPTARLSKYMKQKATVTLFYLLATGQHCVNLGVVYPPYALKPADMKISH